MEPIVYPLSQQPALLSNSQRLRAISEETADAFLALRRIISDHASLSHREQELVLLAGFAAARNEGGFRVHCLRAAESGVTLGELEQVVLSMLGTNLGIAPVVETLTWLHDELKH